MALGHWLKDYIGPKASAQGGGGTSEPLIVGLRPQEEVTSGDEQLDKTFGELRIAFMNGQAVIFHKVSDTGVEISALEKIDYNIRSESANGNVAIGNGYSVELLESPFTLEALDAEYPYLSY